MGKKSLSIDMKHEESMDVVLKLLEKADVFLANFTQRALDDLGLTYEVAKARNPEIIYAVCSGFGPTGPLAGKKGFDGAAQARGGIVSITGPDAEPVMIGDVVADTGGGVQLALGIMTALYSRERTGKGQAVKTSVSTTPCNRLFSLAAFRHTDAGCPCAVSCTARSSGASAGR